MKYFTAFLLSGIILSSCHTNPSSSHNTNQTKDSLNTTQELIRKFKPIIHGYWVLLDYIEELKKTKSPYSSQFVFKDQHGFYIDTGKVAADSLVVAASYGAAGPEPYSVFFKCGIVPNSLYMVDMNRLDTSYLNLGYEITKNDTILIVYHYSKDAKRLTSIRKYLKAPTESSRYDTITGSLDGESYFINKYVIAGNYTYIDGLQRKHLISLTDFGEVSGFDNFIRYNIFNDFGQGPPDSDAITFISSSHLSEDYFFRIDADTLNLFDYGVSPDYDTVYNYTLKYKLVRQK